mmetsp:Transcript_13909/g.28207  ORF Transcript_13909/g.28207 Transcript_13909/m.28207 type:complete len:240 (+) Transcript_13909:16-735(+)
MLASVFRAARSRSLAPVCVRALCTKRPAATGSDSKEVTTEPTYKNKDGVATYNYGESLNLPEVTKEQAENAYLEATDVRRAMTPPVAVAVEARDDMLKDRFNYVAKNLNPKTRAIYAGAEGAVEPESISGMSFLIASGLVLMAGITGVVYIRTQWGVTSPKELGDRLREKGAKQKEALEAGSTVNLVRRISQTADTTVKANVDLVRQPTHQMGAHFSDTFKGGVMPSQAAKEGAPQPRP